MDIKWVNDSEISVRVDCGTVVISANREGLLSLAGQMAALANEETGSHIHFDENNALETGSAELIIERVD